MKQFTEDESVKIYNSGSWKNLTDIQLAGFQLYQKFIFCDFEKYHDALNKSLLRGQEDSEKEGVRFRLEKAEDLQKEWESIHNIPEFSHMKELLLPQ